MQIKVKHLIYLLLVIILALVLVRSARAEEPTRNITNCVYGDSVTPEVCDKLTEDNKPKVQQPQSPPKRTVEPIIYEPFEGK